MPIKLLVFLTAVNLLNYLDRYIVNAVEPVLQQQFGTADWQSGLLVSAFTFGYFIFSPLFGYFGSRFDRRYLMALGLLCWSLATGLTGFTSTFGAFFLARIVVGIGEASFGPIVPAYLKSRIPDTLKLNSALSFFYAAIPVGSALGYVIGGYIASQQGWQSVFRYAALPGLILAIGFLFLKKEESPLVSIEDTPKEGFLSGIRQVLSRPVLRYAIIGYIFNTFALSGIAAFVVRHGINLGMEMAVVNQYFGGILVIAGFVGSIGGGKLASMYAAKSPMKIRSLLTFVGVSTLLGVPCMCLAFLVKSPSLFLFFCFIAELAAFAGVAPLNTVLVARAPKGLETLTQGVTIFLIQLFGSILAPVSVGKISDFLRGDAAISNSPGWSLAVAMQLCTVALLLSGLLWLKASRSDNIKESVTSHG